MKVHEIMSRSPRTVKVDTNLIDVVSVMCLFRISGLPVVEEERMIGFIAEKDVLHRLFPSLEEIADSMSGINYDDMMGRYKDVVHLKVRDLMSTGVISVSPDMHILRAATVMVRHKFRRIPVTVEENRLVGMLSLGDVHKAIFQRTISDGIAIKPQS